MDAYEGQHRDNTPRPACTCDVRLHPSYFRPLILHSDSCPVTVEAVHRLCIGIGGTR